MCKKTAKLMILFAAAASLATVPLSAAPKLRTRYFPQRNSPKEATSQPPGISLVNAASFLPGVCPGGLATIFGQDLSDITGSITATTTPLPIELAGIQVQVNGIYAGMYSIANTNGQDQISFQVPWETDTGPNAAQVTIFNSGDVVGTVQADSFIEDPGIFVSGGYPVAAAPDGSLISADNPAAPGDTLVVYTTGLGPVSLNLLDGDPAPLSPLAHTQDPFQVLVAGEPCEVAFSGLAPGFVGVYQLNIVLPSDVPPGDLDMRISSPYADSNTVKLPVSF